MKDAPMSSFLRRSSRLYERYGYCGWMQEDFQDYYKILEVEYDTTDENIRLCYRRLALKWHPDKHKGDKDITAKFQQIIEAYKVLSDPAKRLEYDLTGNYDMEKYTLQEYLTRFKGMILTCNGLGIGCASLCTHQLREKAEFVDI